MIPERLKLLRKARGLTLDALSEAMDRLVTKQALSKYESGKDSPSARVIVGLARALGVPTAHLFGEPGYAVQTLAYRSKKSLPMREKERLEALLAVYLEDVVRLRELVNPDEALGLPVLGLDAPSPDDAEMAADGLRSLWNLGGAPIGNVVDTLEEHGVSVRLIDAEHDFDGLSAIAHRANGAPRAAAVLCRIGLTHVRQRLNLAHELGHIVLKPGPDADQEALAWRFAGAFLAPRASLVGDVGRSRRSLGFAELGLLKKRYGMSMQALLMRCRDLQIISAECAKQAFIQMNQRGWRRQEPDDVPAAESPEWLRRTTLRALSEGLISSAKATQLLGEPAPAMARTSRFAGTLAEMPPNERDAILAAIPADDGDLDAEWFDAPLDEGGLP